MIISFSVGTIRCQAGCRGKPQLAARHSRPLQIGPRTGSRRRRASQRASVGAKTKPGVSHGDAATKAASRSESCAASRGSDVVNSPSATAASEVLRSTANARRTDTTTRRLDTIPHNEFFRSCTPLGECGKKVRFRCLTVPLESTLLLASKLPSSNFVKEYEIIIR